MGCARAVLAALVLLGAPALAGLPAGTAPGRLAPLAGRPQMQIFTDREGLRQNSVEAVAMDDQGYAWIGTQDGAMRYDGRVWTPVDMPAPKRSNWVTAMVLTPGGPRWFATNNSGVARWHEGRWTLLDRASGLPSDHVNCLVEGGGTVWAGTGLGPARWTGTRWQAFPADQLWRHGPVRALLVRGAAADAEIWVGTDEGLGRFHRGDWHWFGQSGLPSPMVTALLEGETPGGREIWVGTRGGLSVGGPGRWRSFGAPGFLPRPAVSCLKRTRSREGRPVLWVGTEGGLVRWEGERRRVWGLAEGLTSPLVRSMLVQIGPSGRETVWAGTFGGLVRFTEGTWASLDAQDGLPDNLVFSLHEDRRSGALWFGTAYGLVSYQEGRWRTHGAAEGLPRTTIFALAGDAEAVWVGTRGHGLYRLRGGRAEPVPGLPDSFVFALYAGPDADGVPAVWAGTRQGLSRWKGGTWTHYDARHRMPKALVSGITAVRSPEGTLRQLWVGTRGAGLGVLEAGGEAFTWFDEAKGLVDQRVMHLLATEEGGRPCVWVSTQGGLQQFQTLPLRPTGRILSQATTPGFPGDQVYTAQRGPDGSLFAFTNHGVWRMGPGPGGVPETQAFTTGDGLPSNGCVQGASLVDSHGRVWVGTVLGVAILAPTTRFVDNQPKRLYLEEARNGDQTLPAGGPWQLPWRLRNLKVRFSLLSYHREADTRFRSRLLGLEAEPTAWTPSADREFITLPPGTYTLQVWGRDHAGNESGPVEVSVGVEAPPWQRWWAVLGYALLLAGGVLLLILWRVRRLRGLNARLAARVEAATAEVQRQNEILARVNQHLGRLNEEKNSMLGIAAHDLRNPLNAIGLYAELLARNGGEGPEGPAQRIGKLVGEMSMLVERLLNSSRIDAGQISLQMQSVDPCLLLREVAERHRTAAEAKGLLLELDLPPEGAPELLADPFHLMEVLDNLVSNALKFTPPGPPARRVTLRVREGVLEIQDEGPGFTQEDRAHAFERFRRLSARPTAGEGSTGLGLSIARALLEAMGGEITLHSEPGQGATFRIHLGRA
ncbi:MAG: ATP-binding protein [Holophagaceae bacterium]